MKKIFIIILCIFAILANSCMGVRDEGYINLKKAYKENIEDACWYYEAILGEIKSHKFVKGKKDTDIEFENNVHVLVDYESYVSIHTDDFDVVVAYCFETKEKAQYNYDMFFYLDKGMYRIINNIIFMELAGSYILLSGDSYYDGPFLYDSVYDDVMLGYFPENEMPDTLYVIENTKAIVFPGLVSTKCEKIVCNKELKKIGGLSVANNDNLSEIILNEGLEIIGKIAFSNCPKLKYVVIPSTVTFIGYKAFECEMVFCNVESKPRGLSNNFAADDTKVYWKGEWEYNENGVPTPIKVEEQPTDNPNDNKDSI